MPDIVLLIPFLRLHLCKEIQPANNLLVCFPPGAAIPGIPDIPDRKNKPAKEERYESI